MKKFKILFLIPAVILTAIPAFADDDAPRLLAALEKANQFYAGVRNYEGYFYKTEDFKEANPEPEKIFIKFEKPFKIFMGWENSRKNGLQVFYERGRFDNKLAIHQPGVLFGLVQVVYLDQSSPWVREGSASFNIEDAGIGTFLNDFTKAVKKAAEEKKLRVKSDGEKTADGLSGEQFTVDFENTQKDDIYFASRIVVILDSQTLLPVSQELYDWNQKPIGIYAYKDLMVNSADDTLLKKHSNGALYKVYQSKPEPAKKTYKASSNFNKRRA